MNRLTPIFSATILLAAFLSAATAEPDTAAVAKDTVVYFDPLPNTGSIAPFDPSLRIITADEMTLKEYRSLYDILAGEAGIFVRDLAAPGQKNQIVVNGLHDASVAVMVDGVLYNDGNGWSYNLWNIPVDMIDRIELSTGAGAFFSDGWSPGGTVNIVTKSFSNNRPVTRLRYSQGVDNYVHTDVGFAQNVMRNLNLSLGMSHHGFGTSKELSLFRGRFFNSNDDAWSFRGKLRYDVSDRVSLSVSHLSNRTRTGLHGGVDYETSPVLFDGYQAEVENYDAYEKLFHSQTAVSLAAAPFADSLNLLTLTAYYHDRLRQYRDEENRSQANGLFEQLDQTSIRRGVTARFSFSLADHRLQLFTAVDELGPGPFLRRQSAGVKDRWTPFDALHLSAFATYADDLSYGAEAELRLTTWLSLYAGGADASGLTNITRQHTATAQSLQSADAGVRITVPDLFEGRAGATYRTLARIEYYDTTTTDLNRSADHFESVIASGHVMLGEFHLEGTAQYLVQSSPVRNGTALTLYPEIVLSGSAYFRGTLADGHLDLKAGVRGWFYGEQTGMEPYDRLGVWLPSSQLTYGPSGSMDLFAVGRIGDAYIHLIWENVTNTQYLLAPVYPLYERNVRFGVSWEFLD